MSCRLAGELTFCVQILHQHVILLSAYSPDRILLTVQYFLGCLASFGVWIDLFVSRVSCGCILGVNLAWIFDKAVIVAGAIVNNVLHTGLKTRFNTEMIAHSKFLCLCIARARLFGDKKLTLALYVRSLKIMFMSLAGSTVIMLLATLCLRD